MIEKQFFRFWWVIAFAFFGTFTYLNFSKSLDDQRLSLIQQQFDLNQQKEMSLALREDLLLRINSQSDPAFVELTLMKGLGLVPEEQTKVYFSK